MAQRHRNMMLLLGSVLLACQLRVHGAPAPQCSGCLWVVRALEDAMCDSAANDWLVARVQELVCPVLPDKDQCNQMAETLVPVAVEWLRGSMTPTQICSSVCPAVQLQTVLTAHSKVQQKHKALQEDLACSMCEFVVEEVKTDVEQSQALDAMRDTALKACTRLPISMQSSCSDMVNEYADLLFSLLDSMQPRDTCAAAGLCTAQLLRQVQLPALPAHLAGPLGYLQQLHSSQPTFPHNLAQQNDGMCDVCRMTVVEVHSLVADPAMQQQLLEYGKAMCGSLGGGFASTCTQYIDIYGPAVFVLVEQYLQPDAVCEQLAMCTPSQLLPLHPAERHWPSWFSNLFSTGTLSAWLPHSISSADSSSSSHTYRQAEHSSGSNSGSEGARGTVWLDTSFLEEPGSQAGAERGRGAQQQWVEGEGEEMPCDHMMQGQGEEQQQEDLSGTLAGFFGHTQAMQGAVQQLIASQMAQQMDAMMQQAEQVQREVDQQLQDIQQGWLQVERQHSAATTAAATTASDAHSVVSVDDEVQADVRREQGPLLLSQVLQQELQQAQVVSRKLRA